MKKATLEDEDLVVKILSASFDDNQSINFVARQDHRRKKRIQLLIQYSFFVGMNFGEVFISDDNTACCIMLFPEKKKVTFASVLWDLKLAFGCIGLGNVMKVLKREKLIKEHYPESEFNHLWYIGVLPGHQGQSKGGQLVDEIIKHYQSNKKSICLETSTLRNLPFYERFGFDIVGKIDLGYTLYILKRG